MSNNQRVLNVTRGYSMKHKQACRAVENCTSAWVEFGVSIRDLSLAESIAARNEQAQHREPLPMIEIAGVIFIPPSSAQTKYADRYQLVQQANQLVMQV